MLTQPSQQASIIPYIFDAFPPAGTLACLTIMASGRIVIAGLIAMVIIFDVTNLGGDWAYGTFGFITILMLPIPFILFKWGPALRARSKYSKLSKAEEEAMGMAAQHKVESHEGMQA
jgi:MFS transporter, DHA1 family, multidrug resistance protein